MMIPDQDIVEACERAARKARARGSTNELEDLMGRACVRISAAIRKRLPSMVRAAQSPRDARIRYLSAIGWFGIVDSIRSEAPLVERYLGASERLGRGDDGINIQARMFRDAPQVFARDQWANAAKPDMPDPADVAEGRDLAEHLAEMAVSAYESALRRRKWRARTSDEALSFARRVFEALSERSFESRRELAEYLGLSAAHKCVDSFSVRMANISRDCGLASPDSLFNPNRNGARGA